MSFAEQAKTQHFLVLFQVLLGNDKGEIIAKEIAVNELI